MFNLKFYKMIFKNLYIVNKHFIDFVINRKSYIKKQIIFNI